MIIRVDGQMVDMYAYMETPGEVEFLLHFKNNTATTKEAWEQHFHRERHLVQFLTKYQMSQLILKELSERRYS